MALPAASSKYAALVELLVTPPTADVAAVLPVNEPTPPERRHEPPFSVVPINRENGCQ